jgi:uncharacterized metal-binding protein YceD (DUF177 family)
MAASPELPFSHPLRVDAIVPKGVSVKLEATAEQRKAIARLMRILDVEMLRADLFAIREDDRVRVTGSVTARAVQACVVTLDPVPQDVSADVEVVFAPKEEADALMRKAGLPDEADMDDLDLDDIDIAAIDLEMLNDPDALPEPIIDGVIDLGQIAYDTLAVELDPYPRKEGAVFEPPPEPEDFGNPFAQLRSLKTRQ